MRGRARVCLQAVRAGRRVVMITEVGVGDLAERVPAGGGVHGRPLATFRAVVRVADVQSA